VCAELLQDDSVVLYDPRTHLAHALSASAGLVWSLCDGAHDTTAIAQALADTYDASIEQILADVERLLQSLRAAGLVT
jgi:PqqD family protein of HPr-rel-A system